jgi:beta-xylosidase
MYASPYYMQMKTTDMHRWDVRKILSSHDTVFPDTIRGKILWDCEGSFYNGKYLLYGFCLPDFYPDKPGGNYMFVLESDNPAGPYTNFRWIIGNRSGEKIDGMSAQILVDDDGSRYITYATYPQSNYNTPVVARLVDNHIINEDSRKSLAPYVKDFFENASLRKRNDTYYLLYAENIGAVRKGNFTPKRLSYCTSKNVFGPYTYHGPVITVEHFQGNTNIQGTIEKFDGQWYVFYHRVLNGLPFNRSECVEKIEFDKDGLIIPVVPTSSGVSEGLNTALPVWFSTAVYGYNYRFTDESEYGNTLINGAAEIGFRYIAFTGKERQLTLQGSGLENIVYVKVIANGRIIGENAGASAIHLNKVSKGKAELTLFITTTGDVRIETFRFNTLTNYTCLRDFLPNGGRQE